MKTILFFSPTGYIGGAERSLINMCKYLPEKNYRCIVVLPNEGQLPEVFNKLNAKTVFFNKYFLQSGQIINVIIGTLLLLWKLRKEKIDIIHSNSIFSLYIPIFFAWVKRKQCFVHWADFDVRVGDRNWVNFFRKNTTVIAISECIKKNLIENKIRPEIITLLYYGNEELSQEENREYEIDLREKYNLSKDTLVLGITGRIDEWKGHKYILKALGKLKNETVVLFVLGNYHLLKNPNLKVEVEAIINESEIQDKVIFLGHVNNPAHIIRQLDVVLAPSYYEPFGLVATEAMVMSKAVIASDTGGFKESVISGETGFLVPPKTVDEFSDKIKIYLDNRELVKKHGQNGYNRFIDRFTMDQFIANLNNLYTKAS
jgi:glycosyltransferase involved in cell wall biosynthesis